jgi:hypothetical protein
MGLFSNIGKVLGGIAKAGLSVATHGVSDKIISGVKGLTARNPKPPKTDALTEQNMLASLKYNLPLKASRTEARQGEGWNFATAGKRARARGKPKPRSARIASAALSAVAPTPGTPRRRRAPTSPAMNAQAQKIKALAAEWRALGGRDGTGLSFFDWKRGR